jgi:hypothetical protein
MKLHFSMDILIWQIVEQRFGSRGVFLRTAGYLMDAHDAFTMEEAQTLRRRGMFGRIKDSRGNPTGGEQLYYGPGPARSVFP